MIRSLIIDDLTPSRERFSYVIKSNFDDVAVLAATDSSVRAVQALRSYAPDLVFLTLSQPFSRGFKLLKRIRDMQINVIITTQMEGLDIHGQYALAVRAIRYDLIDFIEAPYDLKELEDAIQKARRVTEEKLATSNLKQKSADWNNIIVFDTEKL